MAVVASEPRTLERLCSSKFAKQLKRASSLLGSGDLWQMLADAEEAKATTPAAQGGDGAGFARRPWKVSSRVVARIEASLSRFTWRKPPPSPTVPSKPPRSPITASVTADPPALSPKSPNLASRRFKQRGAAESQIQFRVSPLPLASVAGVSAERDLVAARTRNAAKTTREEPVGRVATAVRRGRASLSMDDGQFRAWQQQHAAATASDDVDGGSLHRNDVNVNSMAWKAESENLHLGNSVRADVADGSSAGGAHSSRRCTQSGPLRRQSDGTRSNRASGSPAASSSGRAATGSPATSGSGRGGSSRAMVVGVSRSLTPPSSPTVKTFSFDAYRQQQMAAQ